MRYGPLKQYPAMCQACNFKYRACDLRPNKRYPSGATLLVCKYCWDPPDSRLFDAHRPIAPEKPLDPQWVSPGVTGDAVLTEQVIENLWPGVFNR